jgi:DNA adenine methylase
MNSKEKTNRKTQEGTPKIECHRMLKRYGSKIRLVPTILSLMPKHKCYIETFGGSGTVLLAKEPSTVEVYNDLDKEVVNFMRVLGNPSQRKRLIARLNPPLYSRSEYERCKKEYAKLTSSVERAACFYILTVQSLNGRFMGNWSRAKCRNPASTYANRLEFLEPAAKRFSKTIIENQDFEKVARFYDSPQTLHYIDPPYYPSSRSAPKCYVHEMDEKEHERLLSVINELKGSVILSGYANKAYEDALKGWYRMDINVTCSASILKKSSKNRSRRVEVLWFNYKPPVDVAAEIHKVA